MKQIVNDKRHVKGLNYKLELQLKKLIGEYHQQGDSEILKRIRRTYKDLIEKKTYKELKEIEEEIHNKLMSNRQKKWNDKEGLFKSQCLYYAYWSVIKKLLEEKIGE